MNTKKFIQILAVSATALITACEERLTSNDYATPITVTSQVSEKTRAGYDNANLPSSFVMDIYQGGGSYDYSLVTMKRDESSNAYSAPDGTLLLWKGTDHSGANIKAMTVPEDLTIDPQNPMTIRVQTNQTTDANVKASDLLGAQTGDGITIDGDNINIEFRHLLSKLYINYEFSSDLTSRNAVVNSITLRNICIQGGYSYKDMNYVNSSLELGNIQMYHNANGKAAEAIFYPHTPDSKLSLEVTITVRGTRKTLTCPIELKSGKSFEGGKLYTMNIRINGTSINNAYITTVKDWISDSGSMTNKKILWIGTSIPTGEAANNYPKMIADATGYYIVNNSRAASYVTFVPWSTWLNPGGYNEAEAYCLSATRDEIDAKYRPIGNQLLGGNQTLLEEYLTKFKGYSYESLIIPYINGEKDNCNVIVIDHGFNDRAYVLQEAALGERPIDQGGMRDGILWLNSLINGENQYVLDPWYKEFMAVGLQQDDRESYIAAMNYVIKKCKEANSNVQIIIGNYFATSSPHFVTTNGFHFAGEYIVKANEAIAKMNNLEIVNVYQYTGLDDENSHELYNTLIPDGIHPHTDPIGRLNRIIANIYLEEFRRIFGE